MKTIFNRWPGGHLKCLTFSYDDGVVEDRQLIPLMNRHGIRGSFHLNNFFFARHVQTAEVASLYAGHEVSCHMATHPFPTRLTPEEIIIETMENRRALESLVAYPVRGLSYPCGDYDARVIDVLRTCGIQYARTVHATNEFSLPADWLQWHPTCHHDQSLPLADRFLDIPHENLDRGLYCFYVWGHSYEFDCNKTWNIIESLCEKVGRRTDIWYATNIEIVDYIRAVRSVQSSADGTILHNPSAQTVWLTITQTAQPQELKPGQTLHLSDEP